MEADAGPGPNGVVTSLQATIPWEDVPVAAGLLRVLRRQPLTGPRAAEMTGVTRHTAEKLLHHLARNGFVTIQGNGHRSYYRITRLGLESADRLLGLVSAAWGTGVVTVTSYSNASGGW